MFWIKRTIILVNWLKFFSVLFKIRDPGSGMDKIKNQDPLSCGRCDQSQISHVSFVVCAAMWNTVRDASSSTEHTETTRGTGSQSTFHIRYNKLQARTGADWTFSCESCCLKCYEWYLLLDWTVSCRAASWTVPHLLCNTGCANIDLAILNFFFFKICSQLSRWRPETFIYLNCNRRLGA